MMRTVTALAARGEAAIGQAQEEKNLSRENQGVAIGPRSRAPKEQATDLTGLSPEID